MNLNVFDKNDNLILLIADNELIYSTVPWDIELVGCNLIIREAPRKILIDILFDPPSRIKIQRGHFLHNGIEAQITETYLYVMNNKSTISGNYAYGLNALNLGNITKSKRWGYSMSVEQRYVRGHDSR